MADEIIEDVVVEDIKKPDVVFEDEWEIIPEDQAQQEGTKAEAVEPPEPDEETLERLVQERLKNLTPQVDTNAGLVDVLKDLKTTLAPKEEAPEVIDWDKLAEEVADDLTRDPAKAVKTLMTKMNQNVGGAFQYQQQQLQEQQKTTSKLIAKSDAGLALIFDNWGDEVDAEVAKIKLSPGQSALSAYNEAAAKVKMNHLDEIIEMKIAEKTAKPAVPDAKLARTGVSATPSSGPVEGQARKVVKYAATPAQLQEIKRSINPDIVRARMIRLGQLRRVN